MVKKNKNTLIPVEINSPSYCRSSFKYQLVGRGHLVFSDKRPQSSVV